MADGGVVYGFATGLTEAIARGVALPMGTATLERFADGEFQVVLRDRLWGKQVVLVVPTGPPTDSHLMMLALMADAARRAGASRIVAVVPYFGYARSERMAQPGAPIAARLAADLMAAAGIGRVVTLDLHSPAIVGFFSIPAIELSAVELLASSFRDGSLDDTLVVAPDAGAINRASAFAAFLGLPMVAASKRRPAPDEPKILHLYGEVSARAAIVIDDLISTGRTLELVIARLREKGVRTVDVAATHAVMAPGAEERLRHAEIRRLVVTNSLPYRPASPWQACEVVDVAPLLAPALARCLL